MKKRILSLILALILLLVGCTAGETPDPAQSSTPATTQSVDYWAEVKAHTQQIPPYEGKLLVEYDPNREIYVSLANRDMDYYIINSGFINFFLITRERYEADQIQIQVPIQSEHQIVIEDITDMYRIDSDQEGRHIKYYQYLCLQNADWQFLAQQLAYAKAATSLVRNEVGYKSETKMAYDAIAQECSSAYDYLKPQFNQLKVGDVPEFAVYRVKIDFTQDGTFYNESFEQIEIVIGGKTYTQDVGQIRIHNDYPQELRFWIKSENEGITEFKHSSGTLSVVDHPYKDGYARLEKVMKFEALEDLTLTGLRWVGTQVNILTCRVRVSGQPDYFWDMTRPIEVEKGDEVVIDLYLKDARLEQFEVALTNYLALDYQIRDKTLCLPVRCWLTRNNDIWDTYLMAFEGVDIGAYYDLYYDLTMDDWRDAIPPELLGK